MSQTLIERLFKYLEYKKIPHTRFEKDAGLSNGILSKQLNKKGSLNESSIVKIVNQCKDLNPLWLLLGQGKMINEGNLLSNPKGNPLDQNNNSAIQNTNNKVVIISPKMVLFRGESFDLNQLTLVPYYTLPVNASLYDLLNNNLDVKPTDFILIPNLSQCDGAVTFFGDSMFPLIKAGDVVIYKINTYKTVISWGEIYFVCYELDGEKHVTIKHIQQSNTKENIRLVSYNKNYGDIDIPIDSISKLAIIKATLRYNIIQ